MPKIIKVGQCFTELFWFAI